MSPLDDNAAFFIEAVDPGAVGARIVPFEPWHMGRLEGREYEAQSFAAVGGLERTATLCDQSEYAYTVIGGGRPVACIGCAELWRGVGAAWAFLDRQAPRYWKTVHAGVMTFLRAAQCDGEFHRIQTSVRLDHPAGHRWALRLGFAPEGIQRSYGPDGSDWVAYARYSHDRR